MSGDAVGVERSARSRTIGFMIAIEAVARARAA